MKKLIIEESFCFISFYWSRKDHKFKNNISAVSCINIEEFVSQFTRKFNTLLVNFIVLYN